MIIGLTGRIASGKGVVADYLLKNYNFEYKTVSLEVRKEAKLRGFSENEIKRETLQDIGNELREKYGPGIWMKRITDNLNQDNNYTIDGIRNPGEIELLRNLDQIDFYLISIDAPLEERYKRMLKRAKPSDPKNFEDFLEMDKRDFAEKNPLGQQVGLCMDMSDFPTLFNKGTLEEFESKIKSVYDKIKLVR